MSGASGWGGWFVCVVAAELKVTSASGSQRLSGGVPAWRFGQRALSQVTNGNSESAGRDTSTPAELARPIQRDQRAAGMWSDDRQHHKTWLGAIHAEAHETSLGNKEVAWVMTVRPHEPQHPDVLDLGRQPYILLRAMGCRGLLRETSRHPRANEHESGEESESTGQKS